MGFQKSGGVRRKGQQLGQHFLSDTRYLGTILTAAELSEGDNVVEVGPGKGVLTKALLGRVAKVTAIEIDSVLVEKLSEKFASFENFHLVLGDARHLNLDEIVGAEAYKLVANLPYYAATYILRAFLALQNPPQIAVVMVQREVAQQMVGRPGSMTFLSHAIGLYGKPSIIRSVPPQAFRPPPQIYSSIVRIEKVDESSRSWIVGLDKEAFLDFIRCGFAAPRKKLGNSLSQGLGIGANNIRVFCETAGIDPSMRPSTLATNEWLGIYDQWRRSS
jgi:16S rRNA (adenine1518-N6/adenine1519-N6)-dimethyltransferase